MAGDKNGNVLEFAVHRRSKEVNRKEIVINEK